MKNLIVVMFILIPSLWISCEVFMRATPVPNEKQVLVGKWQSPSGFIIEIKKILWEKFHYLPESLDVQEYL